MSYFLQHFSFDCLGKKYSYLHNMIGKRSILKHSKADYLSMSMFLQVSFIFAEFLLNFPKCFILEVMPLFFFLSLDFYFFWLNIKTFSKWIKNYESLNVFIFLKYQSTIRLRFSREEAHPVSSGWHHRFTYCNYMLLEYLLNILNKKRVIY